MVFIQISTGYLLFFNAGLFEHVEGSTYIVFFIVHNFSFFFIMGALTFTFMSSESRRSINIVSNPLNANPNMPQQPVAILDFFVNKNYIFHKLRT